MVAAHSEAEDTTMDNNNTLRRLRYALDASDEKMIEIFAHKGPILTPAQLLAVMAREDEEGHELCSDELLSGFLDGLILDRRGPGPSKAPPPPETLTNNMILKKLRIAMTLHEDDMLRLLTAGGQQVSRGELTALFRKPKHKHYRECGDQLLRNFIKGLTVELRR
jgi:uncharacterized protein YehS (DUF1456 family)